MTDSNRTQIDSDQVNIEDAYARLRMQINALGSNSSAGAAFKAFDTLLSNGAPLPANWSWTTSDRITTSLASAFIGSQQ